ncbi:MAG: thioredoxin domain-containing protein [Bdellovibrionales bacterium]|nr:thioredoxin domain-containing protein [Bdellovibrionales bacterium]
MKKRFFIPNLILFTSSIAVQLYLSLRSYSLKADSAVVNLCGIGGDQWDCDQALTSAFSELFGIPISHYAIALSTFCLVTLILLQWRWLESIWSSWVWRVAVFSALASFCMLVISITLLKTLCPLCTVCYILSFLVLWPLKKGLPKTQLFSFVGFKPDIQVLGIIAVSTGVFTLLLHGWSLQIYPHQESMALSNYADWRQAQTQYPSLEVNYLSSGPQRSQAALTITEFVDFLCPHCQRVYKVLQTFKKVHPDVRLEYMHFPLDSRGCQGKEEPDSASCYLSKAVFCANTNQIELQDFIFEHQDTWNNLRQDVEEIKKQIQNQLNQWQVSDIQECVKSLETSQAVFKQITEGKSLKIKGTPALFVNGKKIIPSAVHATLEKIYDSEKTKTSVQ